MQGIAQGRTNFGYSKRISSGASASVITKFSIKAVGRIRDAPNWFMNETSAADASERALTQTIASRAADEIKNLAGWRTRCQNRSASRAQRASGRSSNAREGFEAHPLIKASVVRSS